MDRASAQPVAAAGAAPEQARAGIDLDAHARRIGAQDRLATGVLTAIAGLVLLLLAAIVAYILFRGLGKVFQPGFLVNDSADKTLPGIATQLFDSFYMLVITLAISLPISLGAAIFLVEYAPDNWITSAASTAIETLSSLPSIVVGMFGSLFFVVVLGWGISIIAGALALTMYIISTASSPPAAVSIFISSGFSSPSVTVRLTGLSSTINICASGAVKSNTDSDISAFTDISS